MKILTGLGSWILVKSGQFSKSNQNTLNFAEKRLHHPEDIINTLFEINDDKKL